MGEIVNLRRARKAKGRQEAEASAAANRATHGRSRGEKMRVAAEQRLVARRLDGHRSEPTGREPPDPTSRHDAAD